MSELKPIRIGDRVTKFPALTHNALIAGEQKRRNELEQIDDLRKPKQKLPCVVRIAWNGASDLPPGSAVKLGNVLFEPGTSPWAPYEGLAFYADEFSTGESAEPYAVTLDPIKAKAGSTYQIGQAVIPQAYWCKLNVSDAAHEYASRPDSGTVMVSGLGGDKVLWKESGTGEKWAVVSMGGTPEKFRLIRGQSVGIQSGTTILIDNVIELSGGLDPSAGDTATQVRVANIFSQTYADNEYVDAVYSPGIATSPDADWETLKSGSSTPSPPLRWFELTAAKATTDATATAKFLDDAGNMIGDEVTLYDSLGRFYGKAADYVGTIDGFRGIALQRTDLGGIETDRWEIVAMEGFAESVVLTWVDSSPTLEWQLTSFFGDQWEYKRPAADSGVITVTDSASVGDAKKNGDIGIAHLKNPDTSPPTYELRTIKRPDKYVASGTSDTAPATLIQKLYNNTTYDEETDRFVEFEEFDDAGTRKVRGFLDISDLGGGGGGSLYYAGCNLSLAGHTFSVDVASLAGDGLEAQDNDPECPSLRTIVHMYPAVLHSESISNAEETAPGQWSPGGAVAKLFTVNQTTGKVVEGHDLQPGPAAADVLNWKHRIIRKGAHLLIGVDRYGYKWIIDDDQPTDLRIGVVSEGGITAAELFEVGGEVQGITPGEGDVDILSKDGVDYLLSFDANEIVDVASGVKSACLRELQRGELVWVHVDRDLVAWAIPMEPDKLSYIYITTAIQPATVDAGGTTSPTEFDAFLGIIDYAENKMEPADGASISVKNYSNLKTTTPPNGKWLIGVARQSHGGWELVSILRTEKELTLDINGDKLRFTIKFTDDSNVSGELAVSEILKALSGWNASVDQSIGHDGGGDPLWQTDGSC